MRLYLIIIALALGLTDDGSKKGRKGNDKYNEEQYAEASTLYREGIDEGTDAKPRILSGLWNNLGASLFRSGDFEESREAFGNALGSAQSETDLSTFAYNTGNSIYRQANSGGGQEPPAGAPGGMAPPAGDGQALQESLNFYRQALLADPANEDARFNYEFVKRQLQEQEQNQDQQENEDQQNQDQQNQDQQNQDQQQNEDQQNQEQQNQDQQQNEDQQNQEQQQQQDQQQQEQQQQQQQPQNDPNKLSREEAERILQALQNEEEELLRQVMKPQSRPKKVEKDW